MNGLFLETLLAKVISRARLVAKVPGDIVWERARNQGLTSLTIDQYQGKDDQEIERLHAQDLRESMRR